MTLKEIQAQYGDGVWLLLRDDLDYEQQIFLEGDMYHQEIISTPRQSQQLLGNAGSERTHSSIFDYTVLDVEEKEEEITVARYGNFVTCNEEVTIAPTLVVNKSEEQCTCPTLLNGHHGGCLFVHKQGEKK